MGRAIAEIVVELDRMLERRKRIETEIAELFNAHPFGRILGTLPGIGPRTGSRILAEIGDGSRFANGSRLATLRDPASRAFYDRKRAEGKQHNAAVICLARRRCDVILAMLRSRRAYQAAVPHHQPVAA